MFDDELSLLRSSMAAHREMLIGAYRSNSDLDLQGALQVHAGLGNIMASWEEFSAPQQRRIVATIAYLIDDEDASPDLKSPDGFVDDLAELRRLQAFLGYVEVTGADAPQTA